MIRLFLLSVMMYSASAQNCEPYASFPQHTMCIYKEATCQPQYKLIHRGLTDNQKTEVVSVHNMLRRAVADGRVTGAPPAISIPDLQWMEELAIIAQRAADQCLFQHDAERRISKFRVGQNIYISKRRPIETNINPNMTTATMSWFNEVFSPGFPPFNIDPFRSVSGAGHYTQLVWADTLYIGCGYTMFIDGIYSKKLIFCNYGPRGNVIGSTMYKVKSNTAPANKPIRKPNKQKKPKLFN